MVRVAVYTRVSTEDQAKEGFSLGAQKERLEGYCLARDWTVAARTLASLASMPQRGARRA